MVVRILILIILLAVAVVIVWAQMRTWEMEKRPEQALFASGSATLPKENYSYKGSSGEYKGSWQGKEFLPDGKGVNAFRQGPGMFIEQPSFYTKYPFHYYVGEAVRDNDLQVVVLDYNQPGNPWWLRFIRDEMVATGEHTYLGKVHVRFLPNYYFTLGYFTLELPAE